MSQLVTASSLVICYSKHDKELQKKKCSPAVRAVHQDIRSSLFSIQPNCIMQDTEKQHKVSTGNFNSHFPDSDSLSHICSIFKLFLQQCLNF